MNCADIVRMSKTVGISVASRAGKLLEYFYPHFLKL